jgi:hypothetical protein
VKRRHRPKPTTASALDAAGSLDHSCAIHPASRTSLFRHAGTTVTELVYPHQLKPVIQTGATVMNKLFGDPEPQPVVTHFVTQVQDAEEPTE